MARFQPEGKDRTMPYAIRKDHRLTHDGKLVEAMFSPNTGGVFVEPPHILVVHFTYGASGRSSAEWFRDKDNRSSAAHLVIDRDGSAIQCVPFDTVAWHAGKSSWNGIDGLNRHALGIELANWGYLQRRGGGWTSYTGVPIADPVTAVHENGNPDGSRTPIGWEPYPEPQFGALVGVVRALVDAYGISEIVGHDDIAPSRKWDPGPAFDKARLRGAIFGGRDCDGDSGRTVLPAEGLNLRKGPGIAFDVLRLLAQGIRVRPLEADGRWMQVAVLDAAGATIDSGWVAARYLSE